MASPLHALTAVLPVLVVAAELTLPTVELTALVGIVVPAELALLAAGILTAQHRLSLTVPVAAAVTGALAATATGFPHRPPPRQPPVRPGPQPCPARPHRHPSRDSPPPPRPQARRRTRGLPVQHPAADRGARRDGTGPLVVVPPGGRGRCHHLGGCLHRPRLPHRHPHRAVAEPGSAAHRAGAAHRGRPHPPLATPPPRAPTAMIRSTSRRGRQHSTRARRTSRAPGRRPLSAEIAPATPQPAPPVTRRVKVHHSSSPVGTGRGTGAEDSR